MPRSASASAAYRRCGSTARDHRSEAYRWKEPAAGDCNCNCTPERVRASPSRLAAPLPVASAAATSVAGGAAAAALRSSCSVLRSDPSRAVIPLASRRIENRRHRAAGLCSYRRRSDMDEIVDMELFGMIEHVVQVGGLDGGIELYAST